MNPTTTGRSPAGLGVVASVTLLAVLLLGGCDGNDGVAPAPSVPTPSPPTPMALQPCPGAVVTVEPPRIPPQPALAAVSWVATGLSLDLPPGVTFEWTGSYDRRECLECPRELQVIVLDWEFDADGATARHSMEIRWPEGSEAAFSIHAASGPCRDAAPVVCTIDGCNLAR